MATKKPHPFVVQAQDDLQRLEQDLRKAEEEVVRISQGRSMQPLHGLRMKRDRASLDGMMTRHVI